MNPGGTLADLCRSLWRSPGSDGARIRHIPVHTMYWERVTNLGTWPCQTGETVRPGSLSGPILPGFAIRSFMPRRPFIVHVCTKWTSSSPSPRVADHRISYEGDLQSLGEIETGDHRTSPGSCGCGLMSVLNSGSPYNNCWFLLALSGQHGPGCPRRPRWPSTRVPLMAVGNGSTGIVERI